MPSTLAILCAVRVSSGCDETTTPAGLPPSKLAANDANTQTRGARSGGSFIVLVRNRRCPHGSRHDRHAGDSVAHPGFERRRGGERRDERLADGCNAVTRFERPLFRIRVVARKKIVAPPARHREGRSAVPAFASRKGDVERDPPPLDLDRQVAVDVIQTVFWHGGRDPVAVKLADLVATRTVDTVHDLRPRLRKAVGKGAGKEQVFGRAGTTPFSL